MIVPAITLALLLVAVKLAISPIPEAANPIAVLLLDQLYTIEPPDVGELKIIAVLPDPLHTT